MKVIQDDDQLVTDKIRDYLQCIIRTVELFVAIRELWTNGRFHSKWRSVLKVIMDEAEDIIDILMAIVMTKLLLVT